MTTLPSNQGEEIAQQSSRVLTAWLSEQEATLHLLGRQPMPQEDLTQVSQKIAISKAVLAARPVFTPGNPVVDTGDDPVLRAVKERPEVKAAFAGQSWFPAIVNLREVLAFQKIINTEGLEARLASAKMGEEQLIELCLPISQPPPPNRAIGDPDGKGLTVSTLNPNLRVIANRVSEESISLLPDAPAMRVMALTFFVSMGASYLVVVRYGDRYFIRDGYHRAVGLLREHIDVVPCILVDAKSFDEVVMGQPQAFLPYEVLFGDRPPRLTDFWDDDVSHTVLRPAIRKVVRVRGDEFVVHG